MKRKQLLKLTINRRRWCRASNMRTPKELILNTNRDLKLLAALLAAGKRPARIIAFKATTLDRRSPVKTNARPILRYKTGAVVRLAQKHVNCDVSQNCGSGINVATRYWCRVNHPRYPRYPRYQYRAFRDYLHLHVLITGKLIVIPTAKCAGGKFRTNEIRVLN